MSTFPSEQAASPSEQITGARIRLRRRLGWRQTDAAGHNHFSAALEWLEEAEHSLYRDLGLDVGLLPGIPRVHLCLDYRERLWVDQEVDIEVGVIRVGRSSLTLAFTVRTLAGSVSVEGTYVIVHSPDPLAGAVPWPEEVARALASPLA
jgi:acyl-CoA thioester hydrolase